MNNQKKNYIAPATFFFEIKTEGLLNSESMTLDSNNIVNSDENVFSRSDSGWDDEEYE